MYELKFKEKGYSDYFYFCMKHMHTEVGLVKGGWLRAELNRQIRRRNRQDKAMGGIRSVRVRQITTKTGRKEWDVINEEKCLTYPMLTRSSAEAWKRGYDAALHLIKETIE